ncbi:MAG TPA: ATP-binding protein, partial [Terriglobales bacterium]
SPVCDQAGQVGGVLLMMHDVTELAALQKHSDSNERHVAVGQMTAGLVHDFNNVLNTITEAVTVLENDRQRSDHDRTVLSIIGNAVHYGAETIRNTREYLIGSREKPSLVDIRALLDEVLELTHPVLKTHTNVAVVRETQDCGQVNASADQLRRAFTNIVLNALDAMPEGGTLTVSCNQVNRRVVVSLHDTGLGIPLEEQRKIFSPYYTTKAKGTGLGLAWARRAVQAQGGEIGFESTPASGTTFYITLPAVTKSAEQKTSAA